MALATRSETWDNSRHILCPPWSPCPIPNPGRSGPAPSCGQHTAAHSHLPLLQVKMVISLLSHRIHLGICVHCTEQRGALSLPCCPSSGLEGQRFCDPKSHDHAATGCRTEAVRGPGHVWGRASLWVGRKVKAEPVLRRGLHQGPPPLSPSSSFRLLSSQCYLAFPPVPSSPRPFPPKSFLGPFWSFCCSANGSS